MKMASFALLAQRLRRGLTLLGVIIGIVSVVMMVALGESSQRNLQAELKDVPANFLEIAPGDFFGDPEPRKPRVSRPPTSGRHRRSWRDSRSALANWLAARTLIRLAPLIVCRARCSPQPRFKVALFLDRPTYTNPR
jgi:hypothetical protein